MRIHDSVGFTYDDILIRPSYSELNSRQDCNYWNCQVIDTESRLLSPIIAANMKTIATQEMAHVLGELQVTVPSHRFQSIDEQVAFHKDIGPWYGGLVATSIGLNERERIEKLAFADMFFLELAHCDSKNALKEIVWIKRNYPRILLVAGNVATADACKRLMDAGADLIKVGIGNGAVCITRIVTGCGVPQLSAIIECAKVAPIIADGGIRCSGDIVKALAAGAKYVMIGSLLAGTDEAAGDRLNTAGNKIYYGMASREAGKVTNGNVPEGISATVPYAGSAKTVVKELLAGLRQGMAMVGAKNLEELREKAIFQHISPATIRENCPHILERQK